MVAHAPTLIPATPARVLAILQDQHRQRWTFGPFADDNVALTADRSVGWWMDTVGATYARPLAAALNGLFGLDLPWAAWRPVLTPADRRTLGGVCDLIAAHATLPTVRPAHVLGVPCRSAGAFLTVRHLLAAAGADVRYVAPSTPVAFYARRYPAVFVADLGRLAPGALPTATARHKPVRRWAGGTMAVASLSSVAVFVTSRFVPAAAAWLAVTMPAAVAAALVLRLSDAEPEFVTFGDVRTFRDVAVRVAAAG